jgi:chaperonin GroEL
LKKEALNNLIANYKTGSINICPVKIPKLGLNQARWLNDLAALVDATIIGGDYGLPLKDFTLEHLGFAKRISVNSFKTKIIEPKKNQKLVDEKIKIYKESLQHLVGDLDLKDIRERISFLTNKAAVISVGYNTELELREKGDRVEDAIFAVRAALDEGYVIGGGFALWHSAEKVEKVRLKEVDESWHDAALVLLNACRAPARQIIINSGRNPDEILNNMQSNLDFGYNTATGKYGNLIEMGVIDPKKVTRTALENAVSIAELLIRTDAVIADNPNAPSSWAPPAGWRLPDDTRLNHKH